MAELNYHDLHQAMEWVEQCSQALDSIAVSFSAIGRAQKTLVDIEIVKAKVAIGGLTVNDAVEMLNEIAGRKETDV